MSFPLRTTPNGRAQPKSPSPLRQSSNASKPSDSPVQHAKLFPPNQTGTVSPIDYRQILSSNKRSIGETSPTRSSNKVDYHYSKDQGTLPPTTRGDRQSLKQLPQAPNATVTPPQRKMPHQARVFERTAVGSENDRTDGASSPFATPVHVGEQLKQSNSFGVSRSDSRRTKPAAHGHVTPSANILETKELEKLGKSSTSHLRTLSKFAEQQDHGDFSLTTPEHAVAGLQGRRRLQRNASVRDQKSTPGYGGRTWMDQQRQFLQAYEYLCHVGEAKEWIEDVTNQSLPPIVLLEEALRDGVILAELVQVLRPGRTFKIFRHEKLQFRHSDNVAIFFRFLGEMEMPELFRFELVDLYEKKNIPKVIYCIHALSWLCLRDGLVDFRIGNLVGKLEFEHHELEAVQNGLDKAGISMPNFSGVGQDFGAEPEPPPEPTESEEERLQRELRLQEDSVFELQSQIRGALERLRLGTVMQGLWEQEDLLIELQSRIRGDFSRQVSGYRLQMKTFAVNLQTVIRGHLVRSHQQRRSNHWKSQERDIVTIQSLVRARKCRQHKQFITGQMQSHVSGILSVQAAIRGAKLRWEVSDDLLESQKHEAQITKFQSQIRGKLQRIQHYQQASATKRSEHAIIALQGLARGIVQRRHVQRDRAALSSRAGTIVKLQSAVRGSQIRSRHQETDQGIRRFECAWLSLQACIRGRGVRESAKGIRHELQACQTTVMRLQAMIRARGLRQALLTDRQHLDQLCPTIVKLQATSRAFTCRQRIKDDSQSLETQVHHITKLQALARAFVARTRVYDLLCAFHEHDRAITEMQSALRAMALRARLSDQLEQLDAQETLIIKLQSEARASLVRQKFAEKKRYFNENMKKVIQVQSFVRGRQQGEAYKSLTSGANPPVNTVKNFVHLLNDSDFDFDEELEVEKLRKTVGSRARDIEQTEQWITELDAKIGLLAHNKIARDEISRITKQTGYHQLSRGMSTKETFNLKALNKTARAKLELYQHLFVILQTQSMYLARLFKRYRERGPSEDEYKRLELLTISAFGYAQKRREEYYLLALVSSAIKVEADSCPSLVDFQRGTYFFTRIFASYARAPRDRKYVREVLGPLLKSQIFESDGLDLESDPLQIYRAAINDEELRTGQQSYRSPDIPREQAIKDPETRENFIRHLQDMRDIVDQFLLVLDENLNRMPYGARYATRQMFDVLCERYPQEDEASILQAAGNWLWRTYLKPAIADPEKSGAVDRGLEAQQRRNLADFVKVVSQACAGKLFGDENVYLQPLNSYMSEAINRLLDIWARLIDIPDAEAHFEIDVMDDIHAKSPPTLYIKMADVFAIHQIITDNVSGLCQSHEDTELRDVIRDLGSARSNEAEMSAGSSEVTLTLSAKIHDKTDPDADVKALFMETKRCILYIIRVQAGTNLMDIMVKAITEDDLARWDAIVSEEAAAGARNTSNGQRRRGRAYTDGSGSIADNSNNLADLAAMSYPELKGIALENILALESTGRVTRTNGYQDLLNSIALDIRTKHKRRVQRRREADNVRATLAALDEKAAWANEKLEAYNNTFEQNLAVLQNKKGKKRLIMPFSVQWQHERELERLGRTPRYGSFKYRAGALAEKHILREWRGRDLRDMDITIASDEVNVFTIEGSSGSLMLPGASATFTWDDLLEAQYQGQSVLRYFGGGAGGGGAGGELVLDTKLFMQQVSKKFWPEG